MVSVEDKFGMKKCIYNVLRQAMIVFIYYFELLFISQIADQIFIN